MIDRGVLKAFEAAVLGVSRYVDREKLEAWLERTRNRGNEASIGLPAGAELLPAHGGRHDLLSYQREIVEEINRRLSPGRRAIVSLPTGAGKTFTAVKWLLGREGPAVGRIVWVAPQKLLLEQAVGELRACWYDGPRSHDALVYEGIQKQPSERSGGVTIEFVTYQMLTRVDTCSPADVVIADEAHHTQENEFGYAIDKLTVSHTRVIGLSATPGRRATSEFRALLARFDGCLIVASSLGRQPIEKLRELGVYSEIRNIQLPDELGRTRRRGPEACSLDPRRIDGVVDACRQVGLTARVIVYCYSLVQCHVVAAALHAEGLEVEVVGSALPPAQNRRAIEGFRAGEVRILVNVKYVAVGADFPFADVAILTVPIDSVVQFEQIVGRVARGPAVGGTDTATVIDFDQHFARHQSIQSYARFWDGWWGASSVLQGVT